MAEREVLREFLVALGFSVNKPSLKNFTAGLATTAKSARALSGTIAGIAVSAEAMVTVFASKMENLYYLSKRTDATAKNLQAIRFGFGQIGLAAGDADAAIETLAAGLRTNPGLQALMRNLGVADNNDPTIQFKGLMRQLVKMPYQIGVLWAQQFGISENLFKMLSLPGALDKLDEAERKNKELYHKLGIDQQAAAEAGKEYMNTLRDLWTQLGVLSEGAALKMLPYFQKVTAWASESLPGFVDSMLRFSGVVVSIVEDLTKLEELDFSPKYLSGFFAEQLRQWGEWGKLISNVYRLLGLVSDAADKVNPVKMLERGAKAAWGLRDKAIDAGLWVGEKAKDANNQVPVINRILERILGDTVEAAPRLPQNSSAGKIRGPGVGGNVLPQASGDSTPRGLSQNNPGNLRSWGKAAILNGFAAFGTPEEGLSAMAGNLQAYNKQGRNTVASIISKWAPPNENKTGAYIAAISKNLGVGADDRLNLGDPKTLSALMGAMIKHEQGYNPYSPDKLLDAANSRIQPGDGRLAGGLTLNNETHITVNGSTDPQGTARTVAGIQGRVYGDLTRNLAGNVR